MNIENPFEELSIIFNNTSSKIEENFQFSGLSFSFLEIIKNEFETYTTLIKDYFSNNLDSINDIFNNSNDVLVNVCDINNTINIYEEYYSGLIDYIRKSIDNTDVEFDVHFVIDKDREFVSKIFEPDPNKTVTKDVAISNITDATLMIDNILSDKFTDIKNILTSIKNTNNKIDPDIFKLLVYSVRNFVFNIINNIFKSYYQLTKNNDNIDDSVIEYRLF